MMAVCGLVLTSCERPASKDDVFALAIRNTSVGSGKGQQFVNVKCSGEWTLALTSDQGEVDWARLSVTSGSGDKSNVVLSYDANSTEDSRTLKIVLDNGSVWLECSMIQLAAGQHPEDDPDPNQQKQVLFLQHLSLLQIRFLPVGFREVEQIFHLQSYL